MSQVSTEFVSLMEDAFEDDIYRYRGYGRSDEGFGWLAQRMGYYTTIHHRSEGRWMPVYENELDLKAIRAACWILDSDNPTAISIRNRLIEYTISNGFEWSVECSLVNLRKYLQPAIDRVLQNSDWCDLEGETFHREVRDGEAIGFIDRSEGDLCLEIAEPENLVEPANYAQLEDYYGIEYPASWSFGVLTEQGRSKPKGYHFVFNDSGSDWDFKTADRVFHWKRNTSKKAKRGVSDFYHSHKWLRAGEKVLNNTSIGAAIQAAIAYIVEHSGSVAPERIAQLAAARQNNQVRKFDSIGSSYNSNKIRAGQVIDIKNGGKYHAGLLGSTQSQIYIEVMDACLRFGGLPYAMPEHMVTGYAGNNNRSSSDTAESPFLQSRYYDQFKRAQRLKGLLMKIAKMIVDTSGRWVWDDVKDSVSFNVTPPDIVTRDIKNTTDALIAQKKEGWVSDRQAMGILQYKYDDVKGQIDEEKAKRPEDWMSVTNPAGVGLGQPKIVGRAGQKPVDAKAKDQAENPDE